MQKNSKSEGHNSIRQVNEEKDTKNCTLIRATTNETTGVSCQILR